MIFKSLSQISNPTQSITKSSIQSSSSSGSNQSMNSIAGGCNSCGHYYYGGLLGTGINVDIDIDIDINVHRYRRC
ncbi:hssA/2C/7E family protein [Tieghemostelium lacteum]|uniref:HssA/2C/7E family protein n=1 Tax=Tieghemostelium lacteum TaxID=361077 RepID=A0A151ZJM9_TIELA|nr:hssA/2C/7E family protein [Tieghemostelium lacteum]|eukprot:KYQ94183.1 hssA/2C/7E family protein [Tieghemostelium lacteum]